MSEPTKTTRLIAALPFTFISGRRYLASRPIAEHRDQLFRVTIRDITEKGEEGPIVVTIDGLNFDQANDLLAAFNNGTMSLEGRVWGDSDVIEAALARGRGYDLPDPPADPHGVQEEGDFTKADFAAADRAWANIAERNRAIAAGEIDPDDDDDDFYKVGDFGTGEPDPDLHIYLQGED